MRRLRLNCQAMARREKSLMGAIVPPPDHTFISIDLTSGEPSVTSHYSQDQNYTYACFDGIGKKPFYKNGLLMCDDIYVMNMSKSPLHAKLIRQLFTEGRFEGRSFEEQWLIDKEVITKGALKTPRDVEKMLCLALGYGMQPKKMVKQCYEKGFDLSIHDARQFFNSYWDTFSGVRRFADHCAVRMKREGFLVNAFGYRLTCTPRLSYNYMIQSSVSGIIHVLILKLFAIAKYAKLVTIIHDELVCTCPTNLIDKFKQDVLTATASLNADLNWRVKIRTGFAPGRTLYEAK